MKESWRFIFTGRKEAKKMKNKEHLYISIVVEQLLRILFNTICNPPALQSLVISLFSAASIDLGLKPNVLAGLWMLTLPSSL